MPPEQRDTLIAAIVNDVPDGERQYLKTLMKFATTQEAHAEQDYQDDRARKIAVTVAADERVKEENKLSFRVQTWGFIFCGIGIVWIIVTHIWPSFGTSGWGLYPIIAGSLAILGGLMYGELVTWVHGYGQYVIWAAFLGAAGFAGAFIVKQYNEPPRGWHGLFFKTFWPVGQGNAAVTAGVAKVMNEIHSAAAAV